MSPLLSFRQKARIRQARHAELAVKQRRRSITQKWFDILRKNGQPHELMQKYGIDAVPFNHPDFPI